MCRVIYIGRRFKPPIDNSDSEVGHLMGITCAGFNYGYMEIVDDIVDTIPKNDGSNPMDEEIVPEHHHVVRINDSVVGHLT